MTSWRNSAVQAGGTGSERPEVGTGWVLQGEPEAIKTRTKEAMGQARGEMRSGEGQHAGPLSWLGLP